MELKEKIEKLGHYFVTCHIGDGVICIAVKLPKSWIIPNSKVMIDTYGVVVQNKDNIYYFITEMESGDDSLFLAINDIINNNKEIEEKTELLKIKANELTELFQNESLEKLKRLVFTFESKTNKTKKNKKQEEIKQSEEDLNESTDVSCTNESENEKIINASNSINETIEENSSLMNFAVSLIN